MKKIHPFYLSLFFIFPSLLLSREHTAEGPERSEKKFAHCYCVLHEKTPGKTFACSLAGTDEKRNPKTKNKNLLAPDLAWAKNPQGIFAGVEVESMGECRSWCDTNFPLKQPDQCQSDELGYVTSGVPSPERNRSQIAECKKRGIEMPPPPFKDWRSLKDEAGNASIAQAALWVNVGNGALWNWSSASGKTQCYGMRRTGSPSKPGNATGIICWTKDDTGHCPTCFFDRPSVAPSADGTQVGSELQTYDHHGNFDQDVEESCISCHLNKGNPILYSPEIKKYIPKAPACNGFTAVGQEMYQSQHVLKNQKELASCATCHTGWDKEFRFTEAYLTSAIRRAIRKDNHGTAYMPRGSGDHEEAVNFLKNLISNWDSSDR